MEKEDEDDSEVFEVEEILEDCFGDPNNKKILWTAFQDTVKGYGPRYDTWELLGGLNSCREKLKEFVLKGYKSRIFHCLETVDVICGSPPC